MKNTTVATKIWEDLTNAELSAAARLVLLNLYTSSRRNLYGISLVHPRSISCETELPVSTVKKAIAELTEKQFIIPGVENEYWFPKCHKICPYVHANTYKTYLECVSEVNDISLLVREATTNKNLLSKPAAAALVDSGIITVEDTIYMEADLESARKRHPPKKDEE